MYYKCIYKMWYVWYHDLTKQDKECYFVKKTMSKKSLILALVALVAVIGVFVGVWAATRPETQQGDKTITVTVVNNESSKDFEINTDAEMLRGALDQIDLVQGEESEYGLFILTVDGYTADSAAQEWWCVTKGGEDVYTGVESTPIADGDAFELTLKTGW